MSPPSILVTGASSSAGRAAVRALNSAGVVVRASSRSPEHLQSVIGLESLNEHVALNFDSAAQFDEALEGIDRVLLIAPDSPTQRDQLRAFIDAATSRGAHIVKVSSLGVGSIYDVPLVTWNHESEQCIRARTGRWTMLRCNSFMQNLERHFLSSIRDQDVLPMPTATSATSYIHADDVGAVAARILLSNDHIGRCYTLTGTEALNGEQLASALSRGLGREIRFIDLPESVALESMRSGGVPTIVLDAIARLFVATKRGDLAAVSDDVQSVLRRAPQSIHRYVQERRALFTAERDAR